MLVKRRHSILYIILVLSLTLIFAVSLAASKPNGYIKNDQDLDMEASTGMWSGLGMGMFSAWDTSVMGSYVDTLQSNGFDELRIDIPSYQDTEWVEASKAGVVEAVSRGAKVIWGVSSNKYDDPSYEITADSWPEFRQAILNAAQWAQDNGVYEFQIGNEEEYHIDETTMTEVQLINNLKEVATEVQGIFTNGKVSYSCGHYPISNWVSMGKGDIDLLAVNVYQGSTTFNNRWKDDIDTMVNAFGPGGTYITEFSLSSISLDSYSTDEAEQAAALTSMIEYIENSGMERAFFFCWQTNEFGVLKSDGTFRKIWHRPL